MRTHHVQEALVLKRRAARMWATVGQRTAVEKGDGGYKDRHLRLVFAGGWLRRVVNAARGLRDSHWQDGCDLVAKDALQIVGFTSWSSM